MGTILKSVGKFAIGAIFAGWGAYEVIDNVGTMNSAIQDMSNYVNQKKAAKKEQKQA